MGGAWRPRGTTVRIFSPLSGAVERFFETRDHFASSVAFSPDGARLAAAVGPAVRCWDAASGREAFTLGASRDDVVGFAFDGEGKRICAWSVDGLARVWDIAAVERLLALPPDALEAEVERRRASAWSGSRSCRRSAGPSDSRRQPIGSGSRAASHAAGIASRPAASATSPPAIAQVVSRSPRPATAVQRAAS